MRSSGTTLMSTGAANGSLTELRRATARSLPSRPPNSQSSSAEGSGAIPKPDSRQTRHRRGDPGRVACRRSHCYERCVRVGAAAGRYATRSAALTATLAPSSVATLPDATNGAVLLVLSASSRRPEEGRVGARHVGAQAVFGQIAACSAGSLHSALSSGTSVPSGNTSEREARVVR